MVIEVRILDDLYGEVFTGVLVYRGSHNKEPQTGWLK